MTPGSPARVADPMVPSPRAFEAAMAEVGPFEPCPHLAVAVSGGADSMALCLLAHRWAGARGGRVSALTVDHGLRPGSRAEAVRVGHWLSARGIANEILTWIGDKPATGVQEAARSARYGLLSRWCVDAGVLHLLLGHHEGDQAETVLMRRSRGSGVDGLAGMAGVMETAAVRLLRPLLTMPASGLRALLTAAGQPSIEDPSNDDPVHTRSRIRTALPDLPEADGAISLALAASRRAAAARRALETASSALLARCGRVYAEGYAQFHAPTMGSAPPAIAARALGGLLAALGGRVHAPPAEKLERIVRRLVKEGSLSAATLGQCRLVRTGDSVLVCREERGLPPPRVPPPAGTAVDWDGRFHLSFAWPSGAQAARIRLVALGAAGARQVRDAWDRAPSPARRIPRQVWPALPALSDEKMVWAVPHLGYEDPDAGPSPVRFRSLAFRPARPVTGCGRYFA